MIVGIVLGIVVVSALKTEWWAGVIVAVAYAWLANRRYQEKQRREFLAYMAEQDRRP